MTTLTLYGISNCDTVRKARKALDAAKYDVVFRDIRQDPLSGLEWEDLLAEFGAQLVNRRSTTWRGLSNAARQRDPAVLLSESPALMKRPVCRSDGKSTLGWDDAARAVWIS